MSLLAKKQIVYDYMIGKIAKWQSQSRIDEGIVLSKLTSTALMKYQFIINVLSVSEDSRSSLFDLYGNYQAFPHGPVEIDTYYNRNILVRYDMGYDKDNDRSFLRTCKEFRTEQKLLFDLKENETAFESEEIMQRLIRENGLEIFVEMVDKSISMLKEAKVFLDYRDVDKLIEVTHNGLWREAIYSMDKQLNLSDHNLLLREKQAICNAIGLTAQKASVGPYNDAYVVSSMMC